jgi:hypothetical protein
MTAVIATPSNITRQEQKVMNAIMALDFSQPKGAILERPNLVSFYAEWQMIKSPDGIEVFVGRVVLPLDNVSAIPAGAKPWIQAQDLPQAATIPAYYSTN